MKTSIKILVLALMSVINFESYSQPGYAGEWKKTRLYGHSFNSGDFTDEEYDWIRDHFEYFTIEKTHLRGIYGNPSHELTSRLTATKLIEANPRCKPLMIYSIGGAYPNLFESEAEALVENPDFFIYNDEGEPQRLNYENPAENDWYIEAVNSNVDNSDLEGIFVDGFKGVYGSVTDNAQHMMNGINGYKLVNGMDFAPSGTEIRYWPESLDYCDGVFIDAFFRRRVMSPNAGVAMIDACIEIPNDKMFVCFSAYDGYSSTFEFSHAAYLIVAHENTYYRWVDEGSHLWSSQSLMTWHDVFDREMGAPLGKAEKNGYVYTRQFRYCTVTLDVENKTSNIEWGQNNGVPVTGVSLTAGRNNIGVGDTLQLSASVTPSNATDQAISWWSVNDPSIASISQEGELTALKEGSITVTAKSSENDFTSTFVVNITNSDSNSYIGPWDLTRLYETPDWNTTNVDQVDGFTSILYESIDYLGNPVEVYAYYGVPDGTPPAGGWPAVIFAHGGGGTAFTNWVNYWNEKGYAAISMDLEGHYPVRDINGAKVSTPNPGPSRAGVWNDYQLTIEDQWYYHAVSQIILSHSLIASFPEVNADKIGLMGISWGGNLTSTVMGVDDRLRWAIPIYGTGFLPGSDGNHGRQISDPEKSEFVATYYDGSAYFNNVTFPVLWLNSTNDFHFSLPATQQSSRAINGLSRLRYTLGLGHSHGAPFVVEEIYHFANSVVNGGEQLTTFSAPAVNSGQVSVQFNSSIGVNSAQLLYTTDGEDVIWPDKTWTAIDASVSGNTINSSIPNDSYAVFFTATDTQNLMISSEYILTDGSNEEEITDDDTINLALLGVATQSTTAFNGPALLAIDDNLDGIYRNDSVTHTNVNSENPWWQVDLGELKKIESITVWNRIDCCSDRLYNFRILVLDENGNTVYNRNVPNYIPDPAFTTNPNGVQGRFVKVQMNGTGTLSLAEVQVFGSDIETSFGESTLVHMKKRNADDFAIDGNWDAENRQNVYLWTSDETNINQLWYEIDRGDGYYSYQKYGTDYCLDGNKEGANGQSVYLWERDDDNWNQHWKKVSTGSGTYRLEKRNAPNFALDGGENAEDGQDLYLWSIGDTDENQQWIFTYVEEPQQKFLENTNVLLNFYPNPVQSLALIQNAENSTLHVYDVTGKLILTQNIITKTAEIDLSELVKGIYYAKITSLTSIDVLKIVKQ